ncbi:MAG: KTSC domain-containing protein [Melioribacteraceae bacterium]
MKIKLTPDSSQIHSIGYDEERKTFEIVYKNMAKYHYFNVPAELWQQAQTATSIGKFCGAHIKSHDYKLIK